jgi:signal peptidase II
VVVAADQAVTSLALADLHRPVHVWGPFGLALQYNRGSAFNVLTGSGPLAGILAALITVAVAVIAWRATRVIASLGFGLVLGGAVGNLADRLVRSHRAVVDYVTLTHWPTFNVGDACITVGVVLLVISLLWSPHRAPARTPGMPGERGAHGPEPDAGTAAAGPPAAGEGAQRAGRPA